MTQRRRKAGLSADQRTIALIRAELELREECAKWSAELAAAKRAHQKDSSPEARVVLRAAMEEHHRRRKWLRQAAEARRIQRILAGMAAGHPHRPALAAELARLAEATGLGAVVEADTSQAPHRPGDATARSRTIRATTRGT